MLNIAICDDQKIHCKITYDIIKKYEIQRDMKFNVDVYLTGDKLLSAKKRYDFIFMDIELKDENGMSVANKYREKENAIIILLTSHDEEMANGYKIKVYRFLVKPLVEGELFEALDSGIDEINTDKKILVLDGEREAAIKISSIMYLEAGVRNTGIRTQEKFYMIHKQISDMQKEFSDPSFYMTHRSYIVNLNYVEEIGKTEILLSNGERIKLSRLKLTDFKKRYYEFIRESVRFETNK